MVMQQYRGIKIAYVTLVILAIFIALALILLPYFIIVPEPTLTRQFLLIAAITLVLGTLGGCWFAFRQNNRTWVITFFTSWLFLLIMLAAIPYVESRTIAPLVKILQPILKPQDEVIAYNQYYQDLPFYLERHISVLNWRNELTFGIQHQNKHDWMINDHLFWQQWHSNKRVFVFLQLKEYQKFQLSHPQEKPFLLGKTTFNALISNK
jgi:hypothetical protein